MSMKDDCMRTTQITTFHCAVCGEQLNCAYSPDSRPRETLANAEPTGAAMLRTYISRWPCSKCMQPAKDAASALATLAKIAGSANS